MAMAFELFELTGKRALVTGSSQGIGFALAQGLAEHGAEVVLNGRDAAKLDAAAAKLAAAGHKVSVAGFDVTHAQAVKEGVAAIEQNSGAIDILVNNAGMQFRSPLEDFPAREMGAIARHQYFERVLCRPGRRPSHDSASPGQDHQHRIRAERTRASGHRALHGHQGRGEEPDPRHVRRLGRNTASRSMRSRRATSRPRSTRRWSTIRNSRAGSKSGHRPAAGEMSRNWSGPPCSCPARLRPSSTAIRFMSMVGSPPVSRIAPINPR